MIVAEEDLGKARLQGDHGRLVYIAEGQVSSADEVIHFVAKDAVAGTLREDVADDLDGQLDGRHGETDPDKAAKAFLLF